jgi:hypothetical protein
MDTMVQINDVSVPDGMHAGGRLRAADPDGRAFRLNEKPGDDA